jgi:hypothetical protein
LHRASTLSTVSCLHPASTLSTVSCLHRASTVSKHFLLFRNDAHNYKITGILKQLKFRRSLWHVSVHAGNITREPLLCLAKTTVMVLYPRRLWRGQCHGSIPACCAGVRYPDDGSCVNRNMSEWPSEF